MKNKWIVPIILVGLISFPVAAKQEQDRARDNNKREHRQEQSRDNNKAREQRHNRDYKQRKEDKRDYRADKREQRAEHRVDKRVEHRFDKRVEHRAEHGPRHNNQQDWKRHRHNQYWQRHGYRQHHYSHRKHLDWHYDGRHDVFISGRTSLHRHLDFVWDIAWLTLPLHLRPIHLYLDDRGDCYVVEYRHHRKVLIEAPDYECY